MTDNASHFKDVLDAHHQWPCPYVFKFIVPSENLSAFHEAFPGVEIQTRQSKSGKYTSITMESTMCSSQAVLEIYETAAEIPGLMTL